MKLKMRIKLKDNSIYTIPKEWMKALKHKMISEGLHINDKVDVDLIKEVLIEETDKHWKKKTVPTKYGVNESWKEHCERNLFWKNVMVSESKHQTEVKKELEIDLLHKEINKK